VTVILDVLRHEVLNHAEVMGANFLGNKFCKGETNNFGLTTEVIFLAYKNVGRQYGTCFVRITVLAPKIWR
jgi:hypothetical protein